MRAASLSSITIKQLILCGEEINARLDGMGRERMSDVDCTVYPRQRNTCGHSTEQCAVQASICSHSIESRESALNFRWLRLSLRRRLDKAPHFRCPRLRLM